MSPPSSVDTILKTNDAVQRLPICKILDDVRQSVREKNNLLLEASPGAGKTTVVPLVLSSFLGSAIQGEQQQQQLQLANIIVVEPRRVAARSAAQRMSDLLRESSPGGTVGYLIRGETAMSHRTKITVVTDGVLLNMLQDDPELTGVAAVVLDEFHERGVGTDTALALCREVQTGLREDLRIVVMSATLLGGADDDDDDADDREEDSGDKLLRTLGGAKSCSILSAKGRQFPITYRHAGRAGPSHRSLFRDVQLLASTAAEAAVEGLRVAPLGGDVLVFLPGAKEICRTVEELSSRVPSNIRIFPLYGSLPKSDQDRALTKANNGTRRVIVSSPIAEASLTIEGVTVVVDSGLCREPRYDSNIGLPRLVTVACSKDSAVQRAGRAGRTTEGLCLRLYTEGEFSKLSRHSRPEIQSADLVPMALLLAEWGCSSNDDILDFPFVDAPPENALEAAVRSLLDLGVLEEMDSGLKGKNKFRVTPHGKAITRIPTHPRFSTSIAKAMEGGDRYKLAAAVVAAAIMEDDVGFSRRGNPNLSLRVKDVLKTGRKSFAGAQLLRIASRIGPEAKDVVSDLLNGSMSPVEVADKIGEALLPGFIIGQRKGGASYGGSTYMLSLGRSARLDDKSDEGEYLVVVGTSTGDDGKIRLRAYAKVDIQTLRSIATEKEEVYVVPSRGYEVRAKKVMTVGSLELSSQPLPSPPSEEVSEILLKTIVSLGGMQRIIEMQPKKQQILITELQRRVRLARKLTDDEDRWPCCFAALDDKTKFGLDGLLSMVEPWLAAVGSLKALDLYAILLSSMSSDQLRTLDRDFPTVIMAPDGSHISLDYAFDPPMASAKLQQFFGASKSPTVGPPHACIPISLSLLSPSGKDKPLAQTLDLPFFWKKVYPAVRAEMRGRYPKHPWPEDPMKAEPTRLSKKQLAIQSFSTSAGSSSRNKSAKKSTNKRKKKKKN